MDFDDIFERQDMAETQRELKQGKKQDVGCYR